MTESTIHCICPDKASCTCGCKEASTLQENQVGSFSCVCPDERMCKCGRVEATELIQKYALLPCVCRWRVSHPCECGRVQFEGLRKAEQFWAVRVQLPNVLPDEIVTALGWDEGSDCLASDLLAFCRMFRHCMQKRDNKMTVSVRELKDIVRDNAGEVLRDYIVWLMVNFEALEAFCVEEAKIGEFRTFAKSKHSWRT